jgi:hypothetical protein
MANNRTFEQAARSCDRNRRSRWDWIQFACALSITAFIGFLDINPHHGLVVHLAKTFALALPVASLAGRFGDAAWSWIVRALRWLW